MSGQDWLSGRSKWELDSPSLLVDLPVMERNISRMARSFREAGVGWRAHTKGLKVPALAHRLLGLGLRVRSSVKRGDSCGALRPLIARCGGGARPARYRRIRTGADHRRSYSRQGHSLRLAPRSLTASSRRNHVQTWPAGADNRLSLFRMGSLTGAVFSDMANQSTLGEEAMVC